MVWRPRPSATTPTPGRLLMFSSAWKQEDGTWKKLTVKREGEEAATKIVFGYSRPAGACNLLHAGERSTLDSSPLSCSLPRSVCIVTLPAIHSNALFFFTFNWTRVNQEWTAGQEGVRLFLNTPAAGREREGERGKKRKRKRRLRGRPIAMIRQHERKPSHFLRGCQTIDYEFICQRTE